MATRRRGKRASGSGRRGPKLVADSAKREGKRKEASELGVGDRVLVRGIKPGVIQYVGATSFGDGIWIGIELDKPHGLNDGRVSGTRYFACDENHVCQRHVCCATVLYICSCCTHESG